jgi:hypothetical protein
LIVLIQPARERIVAPLLISENIRFIRKYVEKQLQTSVSRKAAKTQRNSTAEPLEKLIGMAVKTLTKP